MKLNFSNSAAAPEPCSEPNARFRGGFRARGSGQRDSGRTRSDTLAAFTALSLEDGGNFTAGLPIVRTSPDHGTAFEMAGRDEADPLSMRAALFTAVDIWRNRQAWNELQAGKMEKRELADAPRKERPGKPQIA